MDKPSVVILKRKAEDIEKEKDNANKITLEKSEVIEMLRTLKGWERKLQTLLNN
jgi:hypothetical protein